MSLINEKELGESIVKNAAPKLQEAQARLETWAEGFLPVLLTKLPEVLATLLDGKLIRIRVPLGDKVIEATIEVLPKL